MAMATNAALDITIGIETQHKNIEIAVSKRRKYMTMTVEKSTSPLPEYPGPYNVKPRLYYGNTLETKDYRMTQNVTVEPIPVVTTANPYNGNTVVIG